MTNSLIHEGLCQAVAVTTIHAHFEIKPPVRMMAWSSPLPELEVSNGQLKEMVSVYESSDGGTGDPTKDALDFLRRWSSAEH